MSALGESRHKVAIVRRRGWPRPQQRMVVAAEHRLAAMATVRGTCTRQAENGRQRAPCRRLGAGAEL